MDVFMRPLSLEEVLEFDIAASSGRRRGGKLTNAPVCVLEIGWLFIALFHWSSRSRKCIEY
jgi:hypothetical protein